MKKKVSLVTFIIQGIIAVLLFMPCIYLGETWTKQNSYFGGYLNTDNWSVNFFEGSIDAFPNGVGICLSCITFVLIIIGIIVYVLLYVGSKKKMKKFVSLSPLISFIMFIFTTIMIIMNSGYPSGDSYYSFSVNWLSYIVIGLMLSCAVISILITLGKIDGEKKIEDKKGSNSNFNAADELKKYKELLDTEAITLEEYKKKKKELLDPQ